MNQIRLLNVKAIFSLRKYIDCEGFDFDCFDAIYIFSIISRFLRRFNDMFEWAPVVYVVNLLNRIGQNAILLKIVYL